MLLPLPEACLFGFNLLGELFPERLFFLLELRVIGLFDTGLAKLAGLHLFQAIVLVVRVLRCANQVQHVRADQQGAKFTEIAVVLVLDCFWGQQS